MTVKPKQKTWTTGDGRKIIIREMTDEHLLNTLTVFERSPTLYEKKANKYLDLFEEARRRKLR
jgi:hypothetical protein